MMRIREKWGAIPQAVKVSTAYAVCNILQRCLSFITLPLFARLLTTEQYGQYTVYTSWSGILGILLTLNLAYGSFSTAMSRFEGDRDGYISAVEGICLALAGVFLAVYLPFRGLWNRLFELPTPLMLVMVAELLCVTATQLWSGKKRFEFKYRSVVAVTLASSAAAPALALLLVVNTRDRGVARIVGYAAVNIAVGAAFYIMNAVRGGKPFDRKYWRYALGFNVPLLAYYLSQVVFNQSDRIMISHMIGKDMAAVYGVAYSLGMILTFVLNAINSSYVPWLYGKIKAGEPGENRRVSLATSLLMAVLLLGVSWFAPEIIRVMAGGQYVDAVPVVAPVAVSVLLLYYAQLFINVEFYYEEKKKLVSASIGAALANLALNWIFIQWFGYVAAAYTTLASYIMFTFSNYRAMKAVMRERGIEDSLYDYRGLALIFLMLCALTALGAALYRWPIARLGAAAAVLLAMIVRRRTVIGFCRLVLRRT